MLEELDAYRDEDFVRVAYQICRWHHERYDGSGYPDQLVGEQIPIAAQVVGLADAYETLTTGSGSQPPVPCAAAVQMLCTGEAGAFNPVLLDCLRESTADIRNIKAYLLEMLFNAPATCGSYYRAKVNHDFHDSG